MRLEVGFQTNRKRSYDPKLPHGPADTSPKCGRCANHWPRCGTSPLLVTISPMHSSLVLSSVVLAGLLAACARMPDDAAPSLGHAGRD